jgi:activator of HSP90 ATPase
MGKVGLVYFLNVKGEKGGKSFSLKDFDIYSVEEDIVGEDRHIAEEIFTLVKEYERIAREELSNKVLYDERNRNESGVDAEKEEVGNIGVKNVSEARFSSIRIVLEINCKPEEIIKFLVDKDFIDRWTGGQNEIKNGNLVILGRVFLKDTVQNGNTLATSWKLKDWRGYSAVRISAENARERTLVSINQSDVPVAEIDSVKDLWINTIFRNICFSFNFVEKIIKVE